MSMKKGLSLIEVLIAILIFAVGILAVLRMVTHNIFTVDKIKLQTDATMLASQAMQMVYTLRNTNIMKGLPRDCALPNELNNGSLGTEFCNMTFPTQGQVLTLSMQPTDEIDANPYVVVEHAEHGDFHTMMDATRLYAHTGTIAGETQLTRYNHDQAGSKTSYARYLSFEPLSPGDGRDYDQESALEVKSVVLIQK